MRYAERGRNGRSFVMVREHAEDVSVIRCIVDRFCGVHAVVHERASAVTSETGAQMTQGVSLPHQSVWTRGPPAHSQIHAICHSKRINPYLLTSSEWYRCCHSIRCWMISIFIYHGLYFKDYNSTPKNIIMVLF